MTEISMQWDGTTVGDATLAQYDQEEVAVWAGAGILYDMTVQGILYRNDTVTIDGTTYDLSNLLAVTNPSGTTLRVASGAGIVAGWRYFNSGNEDLAGYAPSSGTNYFRVVLQLDWSAQTVRIALLADAGNSNGGASTASATPAVTQTWGTKWEISLATVTIDSTPTVTVTDTRRYIPEIQTSMIADDAVTNAKVSDDAVDTDQLADNAITNAKVADDAVDTDELVDGAITNAKIANQTVQAAKIANRVRTVFVPVQGAESGGSAIDYNSATHGFDLPDGATGYGYANYRFPDALEASVSLTPQLGSVKAIVIGQGTGDVYTQLSYWFGEAGEAFNNTTGTPSNTDALVDDELTEIAETDLSVAGVRAGDVLMMTLERLGAHGNDTVGAAVTLVGFLIEYAADA